MLAKIESNGWRNLAAHSVFLPLKLRLVQDNPKLVVTLVTPSLSCERTAQDEVTTSTRLTLRNLKLPFLILDIPMKASPAIFSLANNVTLSLFIDYSMVQ